MSGPFLRSDGGRLEFRLEAVIPGLEGAPEELVNMYVEMETIFGVFRGIIRSVDIYVDETYGPGHWVTMELAS